MLLAIIFPARDMELGIQLCTSAHEDVNRTAAHEVIETYRSIQPRRCLSKSAHGVDDMTPYFDGYSSTANRDLLSDAGCPVDSPV